MARNQSRPTMLLGLLGIATTVVAASRGARAQGKSTQGKPYEVAYSDAQWRARLRPEQYAVLRQSGTEVPESSPLDHETRPGTYDCAGCALPLFDAKTKFDSGTGWPSFYAPLPTAVATTTDRSFFEVRTEVHCRRCGSHLGHVFDDGPRPTGLRYCMNGVALAFRPARGSKAN